MRICITPVVRRSVVSSVFVLVVPEGHVSLCKNLACGSLDAARAVRTTCPGAAWRNARGMIANFNGGCLCTAALVALAQG